MLGCVRVLRAFGLRETLNPKPQAPSPEEPQDTKTVRSRAIYSNQFFGVEGFRLGCSPLY